MNTGRVVRWVSVAIVLVVAAALTLPSLLEADEPQSLSAGAAALLKGYAAQAAKGEYPGGHSTYEALRDAGMSDLDIYQAQDQLWKVASKAAKKKADADAKDPKHDNLTETQKGMKEAGDRLKQDNEKSKHDEDVKNREQNASTNEGWHLGAVYRDRDYALAVPIENRCRIPQEVTIHYPKAFLLEGPKSVMVPARSTIDVQMTLRMSTPPMPIPPYPPGYSVSCYDLEDDSMQIKHEETKAVVGQAIYKCHSAWKDYYIKMHVHMHGPPGTGGGGGKQNATCDLYWRTGEFFPSPNKRSPEDCREEIRTLAKGFFGPALAKARQTNPAAWTWVPTPAQIDQMTVAALMAAKARADEQAAPVFIR